jgi:uncharacterized protein YegL
MEQNIFGEPTFADNPEPRCPCALILDVSQSMSGEKIQELNSGLVTFKDELMADSLTQKRVEVGIVTFGPVNVQVPFTGAEFFNPPVLTPQGDTPMGAALAKGVELVAGRKAEYRANGIKFFRPWIFLITDGAPTDRNSTDWNLALQQIRDGESSKAFAFFPIGVEGADIGTLNSICPGKQALKLKGLAFRELFRWLSSSLKSVSQSQPGTEVKLDSPTGWATV